MGAVGPGVLVLSLLVVGASEEALADSHWSESMTCRDDGCGCCEVGPIISCVT